MGMETDVYRTPESEGEEQTGQASEFLASMGNIAQL